MLSIQKSNSKEVLHIGKDSAAPVLSPLKKSILHHLNAKYKSFFIKIYIRILRFNEDNILASFNFGFHNIPWLQILKKVC